MPNNRLSHTDQATPMPDNYEGGSSDFSLIRTVDGHLVGELGCEGANEHMPNSPRSTMSDSDD